MCLVAISLNDMDRYTERFCSVEVCRGICMGIYMTKDKVHSVKKKKKSMAKGKGQKKKKGNGKRGKVQKKKKKKKKKR